MRQPHIPYDQVDIRMHTSSLHATVGVDLFFLLSSSYSSEAMLHIIDQLLHSVVHITDDIEEGGLLMNELRHIRAVIIEQVETRCVSLRGCVECTEFLKANDHALLTCGLYCP